MFSKAASRRISFLLLTIFIMLSAFPILACSKQPTAPATASESLSCGSGDVYSHALDYSPGGIIGSTISRLTSRYPTSLTT